MPRPRQRVRLESGLKLDLNRLLRDGFAERGAITRRTVSWRGIPSGDVVASGTIEIDLRSQPFGRMTLNLGKLEQRVQLHALGRNFGGAQWYFVCPASGRHASVLWKPPGGIRFLSRQGWGRQVAYGSQFEAPHDRALSAAQNIRHRLGTEDLSTLDGFPAKPKWMRWRTYDRIMRRYAAYENVANDRLVAIASRLLKR